MIAFGPPPPVSQSDAFDRWARLLFEKISKPGQFNTAQVAWGPLSAGQVFAAPGPAFRALSTTDMPAEMATDAEVAATMAAHVAAADPHAQYAYNNGFENRTDSAISFDNATRTLTVTPTGPNFKFWSNRVAYTKSTPQTVQITDTEGLWFAYFDTAGALVATQSYSDDIFLLYAAVVFLYWDAANNAAILVGDERHGHTMDSATHLYNHNTRKTVLDQSGGLALGDILSDASGDLATHVQFSVSGGAVWDEDIRHGVGTLAAPANIPIYYRSGAAGDWRRKAADNFPLIYANPGARAAYNQFTGGAWQLTEVANLDFVLVHYFAVGTIAEPRIIGICGQATYATQAAARAGAEVEIAGLVLTNLPSVEFVAIATVIFQTATAYTNTPKSRIRTTDTGEDYIDWRMSLVPLGGGGGTVVAPPAVAADFPFVKSDGTSSDIPVTGANAVPFFLSDGSESDIRLIGIEGNAVINSATLALGYPAAYYKEVTVADAQIVPTSKVVISVAPMQDSAENSPEFDQVWFNVRCGTGSFVVDVMCESPIGGNLDVIYIRG